MLHILNTRRTSKMIGDLSAPEPFSGSLEGKIDNILSLAGNAPFHYACDREHLGDLNSPVPWRVYKLGGEECRRLMAQMIEAGDTTKIPNMLAAAQMLLQVTWLPDAGTITGDATDKDSTVFSGTLRNMEHIAAASAFVQSLLLAVENEGFRTYWSSGGPLRGTEIFKLMGMPTDQLLLGSVFLFPKEPKNSEIKPGAMAEKRGEVDDWSRWVQLSE